MLFLVTVMSDAASSCQINSIDYSPSDIKYYQGPVLPRHFRGVNSNGILIFIITNVLMSNIFGGFLTFFFVLLNKFKVLMLKNVIFNDSFGI